MNPLGSPPAHKIPARLGREPREEGVAGEFEEVYGAYGRPVHAYLTRLTGDPSTADELCQETFVRYLKHRESLAARNGALGSWLYRVATNLTRDRYRRRRTVRLEHEPADADSAHLVEARDLDGRVRQEVEKLPLDLRAVFLLRAHQDLTHAKVGAALDISERTAKERFRRARDILAHRLRHLLDEDTK